ncbi:MAG: PHB depolymerase family esterase [Pseudomonadota bacterium]
MRPPLTLLAALLSILLATTVRAEERSLAIGGVPRSYGVMLPARRPAPLVLVLHGNIQQGADMMSRTSWPAVAAREEIAVAYPDGLNRAWADLRGGSGRAGFSPPPGTDDVAFLTAIVEALTSSGAVDPRRVYVAGVSNGGAMAMTMVCARADLFAAAASVIFNLNDTAAGACHPSRPVPMLLMNGTDDPLIPYDGGNGSSRFAASGFWSTMQTFDFWKRVNGCDPAAPSTTDLPDLDPADGSTVSRLMATCPAGRDVVLYRVNGGGHRMPGRLSDARLPRLVNGLLGPQNHDIDGPDTIWAFFARFARP